MRRYSAIVSLLFLALLILPMVVMQYHLRKQIRSIKHEVQNAILQGLPKEDLRIFHFTPLEQKQLQWEHEHEFEWHGQMFDVVSMQKQGNKLIIECWPDQKESALKQYMRTMWARALGSDPKHQGEKDKLYQFLSQLYFEQVQNALSPLLVETQMAFSIPHPETRLGFPFIPETPPRLY